jgi:hypothetical protein
MVVICYFGKSGSNQINIEETEHSEIVYDLVSWFPNYWVRAVLYFKMNYTN